VSCYLRHLDSVFQEAGIVVTKANRKQVDEAIHRIMAVTYKDCPQTWKQVKANLADVQKRQEFVRQLKAAIPPV
jgi:predicted Fe-Mo cluster-binding NifX family protein